MLLKENVIDNWGTALQNIAVSNHLVDDFIEQSTVIIDVLKDRDDFVRILTVGSRSDADRVVIIDNTFGKFAFHPLIINTLKILVERNSFAYARPIFKNLRKRLVGLYNISYGTIWSTMPVRDTDITAMQTKLSKILNKKIRLVNKIDTRLLGGVQVIVGNRVFDGSVKGKLDELRYKTLRESIKEGKTDAVER